MARIYLQIYERKDNQLKYNLPLVGKTMTKSWIREHYGKDTNITNMWRCHKNKWGVEWVITSESRYGDIVWDYVTGTHAESLIKLPLSARTQGYIA